MVGLGLIAGAGLESHPAGGYPPPPLAWGPGRQGEHPGGLEPRASTHSGSSSSTRGVGPRASTHRGSGRGSEDQGGVGAGAQGRREDPIEVTGGVGTQVVVPRASTHSSEVGAQSGGAGTQGGRAAPMEVPNTPPRFARARRGRTNVCMFSLPVLGPSMSFGLWPMWYYRGGLSPSKRPPKSLRSPPVSMPSGHGRSSTSST